MKFLTTILLLCIAFSYIEADAVTKEKVREIAAECKEENGATDDELTNMLNHELLTTESAKCMRSCLMKKTGLLNDDAQINKEFANKIVEAIAKGDEDLKKTMEEIVETCAEIEVPEDHCEAAEAYAACWKKMAEEKNVSLMDLD